MSMEFVIHDGNAHLHAVDPLLPDDRGGLEKKARGGIPRDYRTHPVGHYAAAPPFRKAAPSTIALIDPTEWGRMAKDKEAGKSRLSDIRMVEGPNRGMIPARDQNGKGYCWQHSGVSATIMIRARQNLPYADLSAYGPACIQKHFQDEGGWGAAGVDFLKDRGCPTSKTWPQKSMSRSNDNPNTWAEAALYKITDGFWDLDAAQYDRKLTVAQMVTLLLHNIPVVVDFNWWSHSVCAIDVVDGASQMGLYRNPDSGKLVRGRAFDLVWMNDPVMAGVAIRILNSWGDGWSQQGTGVLTGSKAVPDGAVAPALSIAA